MKDFAIIQRVFSISEDEILKAAKSYPASFEDGIAVVTYNGVWWDDERVFDFDTLRTFGEKMKEAGIPFQVNISKTIGHTDEHTRTEAVSHMVDAYGVVGYSINCPGNEKFQEAFREIIRKYAALKPDVLWIDDDFRMVFHSPVGFGCFCDDCIKRFNIKEGRNFDRDGLRKAILADSENIRALWQEFTREQMVKLVEIARETADEIDDGIILGFMQVNPDLVIYECPDFNKWIEKAKNKEGEIYFRHGSGFYDDFKPFEVVDKNISIARLCAMTEGEGVKNLTEEVTSPYIKRSKSMKITFMEALMNIGMAGADGVMDEGIKPNLTEQLKKGRLVSHMHEKSTFLNEARRLIKGKVQRGAYPFFDKDLWRYSPKTDHMGKMNDIGSRMWKNLFYLGIPVTFREKDADVLILSGETVRGMSKDALNKWLGKGIYADGTSALLLNELTGENLSGIRKYEHGRCEIKSGGLGEVFTDHKINGDYKGYKRSTYWGAGTLGSAEIVSAGCEILSRGLYTSEKEAGIVGTAIYENRFGGRIATSARGPHSPDILSDGKSHQLKNIFDFLAGGKMPVRAESDTRVGLSLWEDNKTGERALFIYNTDFDEADVKIILDGTYKAELLTDKGSYKALSEGSEFTLASVEPFGARVLKLTK